MWETNFWAPFRLIRAALPHMRSSSAGGHRQPVDLRDTLPGRTRVGDVPRSASPAVSRLSESLAGRTRRHGCASGGRWNPGSSRLTSTTTRSVPGHRRHFAVCRRWCDRVDEAIAAGIRNGADPAEGTPRASSSRPTTNPAPDTALLIGTDAIAAYDSFRRGPAHRMASRARRTRARAHPINPHHRRRPPDAYGRRSGDSISDAPPPSAIEKVEHILRTTLLVRPLRRKRSVSPQSSKRWFRGSRGSNARACTTLRCGADVDEPTAQPPPDRRRSSPSPEP